MEMLLWEIFQPAASLRKTSTRRAVSRDRTWSLMGRWMVKKLVATATVSASDWRVTSLSSMRMGSRTWAKSWRVMATQASRSLTRKSPPPVKPEKSSLKRSVSRSSREAYIRR